MIDMNDFTTGLFDRTALDLTLPVPRADATPPAASVDPAGGADAPDAPTTPEPAAPRDRNLYFERHRALARGWTARARENLAAIRLSKELEAAGRAPTPDEQARLLLSAAGRDRFPGRRGSKLAVI
jgi:hypothetical protein